MRLTVKARELKPGDRLTIYAIGTYDRPRVPTGEWEVMDDEPHHGHGLESFEREDGGGVAVREIPLIYFRCKQEMDTPPLPGVAKADLAEWMAFHPHHQVEIEREA